MRAAYTDSLYRRIANCEVDTQAANNDPRGVGDLLSDLIIFPAHTAPGHIFNCTPDIKVRALALWLWTEFISILRLNEDATA